jgi:hypothetical protein
MRAAIRVRVRGDRGTTMKVAARAFAAWLEKWKCSSLLLYRADSRIRTVRSPAICSNRVIAAVAVLAWWAPPAKADWAYTHWGMTPDQVAAASAGAANVLPAAQRTRNDDDHWEIAAKGTYADGPLRLPVGFMFDTQRGGLICVLLNAIGPDAEALRQVLGTRYGKPTKDSHFLSAQTVTWHTPDNVELTIGQRPVAAVVTHCLPDGP